MLRQKIVSTTLLAFLSLFSISPPVALLSQTQLVTKPEVPKEVALANKAKVTDTRESPATKQTVVSKPENPAVNAGTGTTPSPSVTQSKPAVTAVAASQTFKGEITNTAPAEVNVAATTPVQTEKSKTYQSVKNPTASTSTTGAVPAYQFQMLARIISAEAKGEPLEGQVAVGAVILNRVKSGKFPNTIASNVLKRGQFEPVANGQIWQEPTASAVRAARLALQGWDPTNGALYFFNPDKSSSRWIWSRTVITRIGNHVFAV